MPKRAYNGSQKREMRFPGNSEELAHFLRRKRTNLKFILDTTKTSAHRKKIRSYIDMIDQVLELDYFSTGETMTMSVLIKKIKNDRSEIEPELKRIKPRLDSAERVLTEAFNRAGKYMANIYEDAYNSAEQEQLRELYDEYDVLRNEYECVELPSRVRWWLLGMIHRPNGFFANAVVDD